MYILFHPATWIKKEQHKTLPKNTAQLDEQKRKNKSTAQCKP